jgi:hypothetical protein
LNPLLNPVLSKNIGRWAEVYFTNPPEQREAAVQQLIRDLEREGPAAENETKTPVHSLRREDWTIRTSPAFRSPDAAVSTTENSAELSTNELSSNDLSTNDLSAESLSTDDPSANGRLSTNFDLADDTIACPLCRYLNRRRYRFCGRCGAKLEGASAADVSSNGSVNHVAPVAEKRSNYFAAPPSQIEPPIFGRDLNFESEPSSYRSLYIGIALVIVAFGVGYLAWTSGWIKRANATHAASVQSDSNQTATPQTPSPDSASSTPTANAPVNAEVNSARPAGTAAAADIPANAATENAASGKKPEVAPSATGAVTKPTPTVTSAPPASVQNGTSPAAVSLGGFEELSVARHYLNDANGGEQSRAEAARWLWKSMAKQNIDATVLLGDMYLKGDGVSKSCDQARLLLDAAAIKGRKDAAEQLRHLGAFGCQ